MRRLIWMTSCVGALVACKFPELPPLDEDGSTDGAGGDGSVDAEVDAPIACQPDTIVCDDAQALYTQCSSAGIVSFQMQCPLGCATNTEKCIDVEPSNGLAMYLDMAATAPDLVLTGTSSINAYTGAVLVGAIAVQVPNFTTASGIRVFVVRSLSIDGTVDVVRRYESPSLAFVAHGDVVVAGLLNVSALGSEGGAGGDWGDVCPAASGGPEGAGGGGGGEPGGNGGATTLRAGAPGGMAVSFIEPLAGGCAGGFIFESTTTNSFGGGGGGALQITSRTKIEVTGTGTIDASGGGAPHAPGGLRIAGGGGGGGGNVILEAPQVILDGSSVVISTKGGSGAGASATSASSGVDGGIDAAPAAGGTSPFQSHGGAGGNGTQPPGAGFDAGGSGFEGGGGGGAAGMTVFRNIAGAIAPQNGASVRSRSMTTTIRTRLVP